jgi:AMMECR1 domain-containing protein/orotate phosphoribosyltransferase
MFYSWGVTLTSRGARLAATCLLERLREFKATQLASVGYTGLPLLSACVLLGEGRFTGLCIRDDRKAYASMRRIEGCADRGLPVVVVDDSLVSGSSLTRAIEALEGEGFEVEGGISLVNFPWGDGLPRLRALGYRIEYLFDVVDDLEMREPLYPYTYQAVLPASWDEPPIEDGLHPAVVARKVAERYLESHQVPRPPRRLDADYDGRGGVWVSFRERETNTRRERDGFWHFDPADFEPGRDVVLATVATLRNMPDLTREVLQQLKIAVTFYGPFEKITPGQLDFSRYGILVRSRAGDRLGGALPNTERFIGEVEQYGHARWTNAQIAEHEPHELFRHTVTKTVEPGVYWLPFGAPEDPRRDWTRQKGIGQRLVERARDLLRAMERGTRPAGKPVPDDLIPAPVFTVGLTLYRNGVAGCGLCWDDSLDACLRKAVETAYRDERFEGRREGADTRDLGLSVSILHDQEWLGEGSIEDVALKVRLGLDSVSVQYAEGGQILLPSVSVYEDWSKEELLQGLLEKAGNPDPPHAWAIYPTATWLEHRGQATRLRFGYPDRREEPYPPAGWAADIALLGAYLERQLAPDGLPAYDYQPVSGETTVEGAPARRIHGLWALCEAGRILEKPEWREAAARGLRYCLDHLATTDDGAVTLALPGQPSDALADSALLLVLVVAGGELAKDQRTAQLATRVRSLFQPDGRVAEIAEARGMEADHDFLPGISILALSRYAARAGSKGLLDALKTVLPWYSRRFRLAHPWGMVGWHPQAWAAAHALTGDPEQAALALEICDWALPWQHEKSGAFLCDLLPEGFSFHTGFIAEGVAEAWKLAARLNDFERVDRYRRATTEALRFMNQIILRPEDGFCLAEPDRAVGGVRAAVFLSEVRVDFVSHTLLALVKAQQALDGVE